MSPLFILTFGHVVPKSQQPEPEHSGKSAEQKRAVPVPPNRHGQEHGPDYEHTAHGRGAALIECRVDARFAYLVQKTVAMDKQDEMLLKRKMKMTAVSAAIIARKLM